MRKAAWMLTLWPGLMALWLDGSWTGLSVAVASGAALNLLILASCVWFELLSSTQLLGGWLFLGVFWLAAAALARRSRAKRPAAGVAAVAVDLFQSAMTEYLRGHWYDAEAAVTRLVAKNPKDVEARLLWATLLRRTRRVVEARAQLKQLERLDGAAVWSEEIGREWQMLSEMAKQTTSNSDRAAGSPAWSPAGIALTEPASAPLAAASLGAGSLSAGPLIAAPAKPIVVNVAEARAA
jgi:hypothetical protein